MATTPPPNVPATLTPHPQAITVPAIVDDLGDNAARRFLEFFTANIRNRNTRATYAQAVAMYLIMAICRVNLTIPWQKKLCE